MCVRPPLQVFVLPLSKTLTRAMDECGPELPEPLLSALALLSVNASKACGAAIAAPVTAVHHDDPGGDYAAMPPCGVTPTSSHASSLRTVVAPSLDYQDIGDGDFTMALSLDGGCPKRLKTSGFPLDDDDGTAGLFMPSSPEHQSSTPAFLFPDPTVDGATEPGSMSLGGCGDDPLTSYEDLFGLYQ